MSNTSKSAGLYNPAKIKTHTYIRSINDKREDLKIEFDAMDDILKYAIKLKNNHNISEFRIASIFKGGKESGDIISWNGMSWGGSHAVDVVMSYNN